MKETFASDPALIEGEGWIEALLNAWSSLSERRGITSGHVHTRTPVDTFLERYKAPRRYPCMSTERKLGVHVSVFAEREACGLCEGCGLGCMGFMKGVL